MIFLFTTSDKPFARLIRWGLREDCSHFALAFFEDRGDEALVIESRLSTGVRVGWLGNFKRRNRIIHALQAPITAREEEDFFYQFGRRIRGRPYDSYAIAYWLYAGLAARVFGRRLPHRNKWGRNELVYCVEVLQHMAEYLEELDVDVGALSLDMVSPGMAYGILKESPWLRSL